MPSLCRSYVASLAWILIKSGETVIIDVADYARWLSSECRRIDLLRAFPAERMTAYEISTRINKRGSTRRISSILFPKQTRVGCAGAAVVGHSVQRTVKRRSPALSWMLGMALVLGGFSTSASAAVIGARSGSAADIQAAVNLAKTGDTVTIPAGRFYFTGQVFAPDGIYIKGAGRDSTYLIKSDNLSEWHGMFTIDAKTGQPFKFSGITLEGRLAALQGTNRTTVVTTVKDQGLVIYGAAKNVQIFDSRFTKFLRAGIEFRGDAGSVPGEPNGVIYKNEFIDNWYIYLGYGVAIGGSPKSWHHRATLGSPNAVFVEDNYFSRNRHCVTSSNGAIYVARYNTVVDNYQDAGAFDAHGLSPAWPRGTRSVEIYRNTVNNSIKRWAGVSIRGGSGVVWGNSWRGVTHGVDLVLEQPPRSHPLSAYPALDQIGNPDGLFIWDNVSSGDNVYKRPTPDPHGIDYWLRENRDYWLTAKPGYVPYSYPHPLRMGAP